MSALGLLARTPSGPAFTVVLIGHVASALLAVVALAAAALCAARLLAGRGRPVPASVRSYFGPGPNWVGRALWLVPGFGAGLLALSGGAYRAGQGWVLAGFVLWGAAIVVAEGVVFRAERRVREALGSAPEGAPPPGALRACRTVLGSALGTLGILVAAMVVMFVKP